MWWKNLPSATRLRALASASPRKFYWHLAGIVASCWLGLIFISLGLGGWFSYQASGDLTSGQLGDLRTNAARSAQFVNFADLLTFSQSQSLAAWRAGLDLVDDLDQLLASLEELNDQKFSSPRYDLAPLRENLSEFKPRLSKFVGAATSSWLISLHPQSERFLSQLESADQLLALLEMILAEPGSYLIVFQNPDELRATGGFLGSLAVVNYDGRYLDEPEILDVYDVAGQLTTRVEAPAPVNQYLSGGQGLNLQDANWWPNFPESADQIRQIYQTAGFGEVSGVVAITTQVVEELLRVTGPIYLPDYQTTATASNFKALARADRDQFFAGSRQKTNFLSHFFVNLKQALLTQPQERWWRFFQRLDDLSTTKAIQLEHFNPVIGAWLARTNLNGALVDPTLSDYYFYWVESNVGINKANQAVERNFQVSLGDYSSRLSVLISNHNQPGSAPVKTSPDLAGADHLHYVNYQRLLLPTDHQIKQISQDGQPLENWDEVTITDAEGREWLEVGFLAVIREGQSSRLTLELIHPARGLAETNQLSLGLQHQAGTPGSLWEIRWLDQGGVEQSRTLMVEGDQTIELNLNPL